MTEISQVAQDTIAIIGGTTVCIVLVLMVLYLLYIAYKLEKPLKELKAKKMEIEIKLLENQLNYEDEKKKFIVAQTQLMEKRSK